MLKEEIACEARFAEDIDGFGLAAHAYILCCNTLRLLYSTPVVMGNYSAALLSDCYVD